MSNMCSQAVNAAFRWAESLNMSQWMLVLLAVLALGMFFLRGFGSRSNY